MEPNLEYRFVINAYTPVTLPMSRLAEYLGDVAKLHAHKEGVHFSRLESGSSVIAYNVDMDVAIEVVDRLAKTRAGNGPLDAIQAVQSINKRLIEDKTDGRIEARSGAEILVFPGYRTTEIKEATIKVPPQPDTLDGVVQRVGKFGRNASILLEDGDGRVFACKAYRDTARKLALHLFGEVRLHGFARWQRMVSGKWVLDDFFVQDFEVLKSGSLSSIIGELHKVAGSGWAAINDPWQELADLRGSGGDSEP